MKVNIEKTRKGAVVTVATMNSVYRLTVVDAEDRLVEVGGSGCYQGEANVLNMNIEEGGALLLGTVPEGKFVRTSVIQKITIE